MNPSGPRTPPPRGAADVCRQGEKDCRPVDERVVVVRNLVTGKAIAYGPTTPRWAVICAYAQQVRCDYNWWNYEARYADRLREEARRWVLGDWAAMKQDTAAEDEA